MKKYLSILLAGVVTLSLCACSGKQKTTNPAYENKEEVTITLTLFDTSKTVEEFVDEMNSKSEDAKYSVYDDHHYSMVITEGERLNYIDSITETNSTLSALYSDELFSNAFVSDDHDDLYQNIKFYVDGSQFSLQAEILTPATSLLAYSASDLFQAYSLIEPEKRVYNFQIISEDSGDVLATLSQAVLDTTNEVEDTEELLTTEIDLGIDTEQ